MNFIRKIFENKIDEGVHRQFRRFGKGSFENRAVVEMNIGKDIKVKTSFEYTNEFVMFLANTIKDTAHISGGIITTKDIKDMGIEAVNAKQFAGVKTYEINCDISKESLTNALDKIPDAVFCLSFSTDYGSLKTKVKSPKPAKPGKSDEEVKANYCVFITKDLDVKKEFAFDVTEDFKKFRAVHDFIINELVVPEQYKNDLEKARIYARRKGKIIRKIEVDGRNITKEINFEA